MITFRPLLIRSIFIPLLFLSGCKAVGPHYTGAPETIPDALHRGRFIRAEAAENSIQTAPLNSWWQAFNDPVLNRLIDEALQANPNLQIAQSRPQQSRSAFQLEKANAAPSGGASALYAHARLPSLNLGQSSNSGNSSGSSTSNSSANSDSATQFNLYNIALDATWEIDLFGGKQRAIEAAKATAQAIEATYEDVQVSLTAEVANIYINLRDHQQRISLGEHSVKKQEKMIELTQQRVQHGTASHLDLIRLQSQLESTRADIVPIQAELESYLNQLATLTGKEPGALDTLLSKPGMVLLPPAQVAVGDPAALLKHRPDIRAAERTLAANTAKIGQAKAARYPSLKLLGFIGIGGTQPADLTRLDDFVALAAPMLSWNFLDFGRNQARITQAEEVRNESEIKYRQTVLEALRNAEDALSRFRHGRITVATLARSKASADQSLKLTQQRYRAGTVTLIDVLDATRQQISAEQGLIQAETALTQSFIAIQKALGLGWSSDT